MADNYTFEYNDSSRVLKVTCNIVSTQPEKIFVKPNYDFGVVGNTRQNTPETDYLNIIKEEILSLTFEENGNQRVENVTLSNGSSYNNGIYLKLNSSSEPVILIEGETIDIEVHYMNIGIAEDRRISFEVI